MFWDFKKRIKYILFILLIISCRHFSDEVQIEMKINWSKRGQYKSKEKYILDIEKNETSTYYNYHSKLQENMPNFQIIMSDSSAEYFSEGDTLSLKLKSTISFNVANKRYKIYNFLRHIPGENDMAVNFFIVKEYGVINILNTANMVIGLVNYPESEDKMIIDSLNIKLTGDTNYYLYNNNLPPLPKQDKK